MSRKRTYGMRISGGLEYNFSPFDFQQVRIFHSVPRNLLQNILVLSEVMDPSLKIFFIMFFCDSF